VNLRRQDTTFEDEAEADEYFKQYLTASFHPINMTADNSVRVIYPLVAQSPNSITIQAVPNLTAQERDHRRTRYKARFWPIYAMSYHRAKRACQSQTNFRMNLNSDDMIKWGLHDLNAYTYARCIWPTQLGG
jgi:hypothetical protein